MVGCRGAPGPDTTVLAFLYAGLLIQVSKHLGKIDGQPLFTGLNTVMTSKYIRSQTLTYTKAHEERIGPLSGVGRSSERYNTGKALVAFTDVPDQDYSLLTPLFPSLREKVAPAGVALGLKPLELPPDTKVIVLDTYERIALAISAILEPTLEDKARVVVVHLDAEWNITRTVGVSCIQILAEHIPNTIYILRVSLRYHVSEHCGYFVNAESVDRFSDFKNCPHLSLI